MNPLLRIIVDLQDMSLLLARSFLCIFSKPRYYKETVKLMDVIGVGSLPIILLTGFFTGGVLTLQSYNTLAYYGAQSQMGELVAYTLIRELGPVLTALMVAGRIGSAISAELGSMVVSQQIDAIRAFGTDPIRQLVLPRIVALVLMLPILTVAADVAGITGGGVVASYLFGLDYNIFVTSARTGIAVDDVVGGMVKPLFFGLIIGLVSCHKGLSTEGGTAGVGRSTTRAVVLSSIVVIIFDFFLSKVLQQFLDTSVL